MFWTRDNGFRRDALESQQTAAGGMARGCVGMTGDAARFAGKPAGACIAAKNRALEHARRFPHGEMRRRNRSAAWFRPAANGFRGCGCRGEPSGTRRRGGIPAFFIGTVRSLALYRARRQREYLGRGGRVYRRNGS